MSKPVHYTSSIPFEQDVKLFRISISNSSFDKFSFLLVILASLGKFSRDSFLFFFSLRNRESPFRTEDV